MNEHDKKNYIARYTKRYKKFGYSPNTLGWGKGGRQAIRFQILTAIGIQEHSSILDVGCGFGDLYGYLKGRGWHGRYVGVDIADDLLLEAVNHYPGIDVRNEDILREVLTEQFDYVVSSGVFNVKLEYEENYEYIFKMLKKMKDCSIVGVAVDFMSSYVDFRHDIAFHAEPEKIFKMARSLSKRVTLRHDYMPYEFAIYIYKDDRIHKGKNIFEACLTAA